MEVHKLFLYFFKHTGNYIMYHLNWGHAVASWLSHYATSRKVAGSSPDEVDFLTDEILPSALWPWGRLSL
jgi:hypothetical protein